MCFPPWLRHLTDGLAPPRTVRTRRPSPRRKRAAPRLFVERLEDRRCPAGYAITDLGTLGGTFSRADAINNSGQVVGEANTTVTGVWHAFLWTPGGTNGVAGNPQMQDLGTLSGFANSEALAVNVAGQVAGYAQDASDSNIRDAFYWDGAAMLDL